MNFKKIISYIFICLLTFCLISCGDKNNKKDDTPPVNTKDYHTTVKENVDQVVYDELKGCFDFFWETANSNEESKGYGLIPDRYNVSITKDSPTIASIASVGYGLSVIPIGVENNWITKEEGENRAYRTLLTLQNMRKTHGFFYHFVNMKSGTREWESEVSIIDTAICMNGALTVGQYYGGRVLKLARELYENVEWNWYYDPTMLRFYMGYSPESGFTGSWDMYAEQLMVYILAAGSPKYSVGKESYNFMKTSSKKASKTSDYDSFYTTYTGSIFTYQFSHAWCDFRNINDEAGVNWFDNSVNASKAAIVWAIKNSVNYKTYSETSWGPTACDGPNGYSGSYGSAPTAGGKPLTDGTIPPCGAIGSIVFTPEESIAAMNNYKSYDKLWSKYGFKDAYNLGTTETHTDNTINISSSGWYATDVIGIDKGVSALMIENYLSEMIWNIYMDISYVQTGLQKLGFTNK